jgi:probable HAF family extracellular repeat protein
MRTNGIRIFLGIFLAMLMSQASAIVPTFAGSPANESTVAQAAPEFRIRDLGTLGGSNSAATAVNVNEQIAGWSELAVGSTDRHAFLWEGGRMRDLGTLGGTNSEARGINRRGWVVGMSQIAGGANHAFLWRNGRMIDLGTLGGAYSAANAINDEGTIVGGSDGAEGRERAFAWEYGTMRALAVLDCGIGWSSALNVNRDGQIVGTQWCTAGIHPSNRAVLWNESTLIALPAAGVNDSASAINHEEQILVNSRAPRSNLQQSYVLLDGPGGSLTELGSLVAAGSCHSAYTSANGVNEAGLIVGHSYSVRESAGCHDPAVHSGFLWRRGNMFSLGTLTGTDGSFSEAYAINNQNLMVGASGDEETGFQHAVLWRIR